MKTTLSRYHYNRLNSNEKLAYECIKRSLIEIKSQICFNHVPNVYKVIEAVRWDLPHLFYVNWITIFTKVEFVSGKIKITVPYLYKKPAILEMKKRIRREVQQFKHIKDPFTLALKAHDYLCYNVVYDYGDLKLGGFKYRNHNIVGSFIGKSAVCESIARAYQFILNLYGVDCMTVVGKTKTLGVVDSGLHAWNIVELDGENYQVDVTWDLARYVDEFERTDYGYFLIDDKTAYRTRVHTLDIKCYGQKHNIYRRTNTYITDKSQLIAFLKRCKRDKCYLARCSDEFKRELPLIIDDYVQKTYRDCSFDNYDNGVFFVKFE